MTLTDPGPQNPLFFFSLALLGKVPNFVPNDTESLNQLECIEEVLSKLPDSPLLMSSLGNVIAVTCDALLSLSASELKKSPQIRLKAVGCLHQLLLKVSVSFASLLEIFPGVLSKMVKLAIGRVDTEDDDVLLACLRIIETLVRTFWARQDEWDASVVDKERFRANVDVAVGALRPLVLAESRLKDACLQACISSIFAANLLEGYKQRSRSGVLVFQHAACNNFTLPSQYQSVAFTEYTALMEWFDSTANFDEELDCKLRTLIGIVSVEGAQKIVSIPQLFSLCILRLFELHESKIGDVVDVRFSGNLIGTENALASPSLAATVKAPEITFKRKQKYFNSKLSARLFLKVAELDADSLSNEILNVSAPLLQMDLTAQFLQSSALLNVNLFSAAMKHLKLVPTLSIEEGQLMQLAALKVLWSRYAFPFVKSEVQQYLPFVLLCSASGWMILREVSTELLRYLAAKESMSLPEFIRSHHQFLLDRLAIQLGQPGLFPEAPSIISALLTHLLDAETVSKFSDLLVGKVADNLALYRTFPGYCRDLLQVAEGTLRKLNGGSNPTAALDLMRIAQYFIVADSKSVRICALEAFTCGIESFAAEDSQLCQLIHAAWPGILACLESLILRLKKAFGVTQLDLNLAGALVSWLQRASAKCPLFLRDRLVKDVWRKTLRKHQFATNPAATDANIAHVESLLVSCLAECLENCLFGTEVVLEIIDKFGSCDSEAVFKLFDGIWRVEPDALWHFFVFEMGGLEGGELVEPTEQLLSYRTPVNCSANVNLKKQLSLYFGPEQWRGRRCA